MLASSAGTPVSPGWTASRTVGSSASPVRARAAKASELRMRAGDRLAQVITGPRASTRPSAGRQTFR